MDDTGERALLKAVSISDFLKVDTCTIVLQEEEIHRNRASLFPRKPACGVLFIEEATHFRNEHLLSKKHMPNKDAAGTGTLIRIAKDAGKDVCAT